MPITRTNVRRLSGSGVAAMLPFALMDALTAAEVIEDVPEPLCSAEAKAPVVNQKAKRRWRNFMGA